jgi:hypothetical protein
MNLKNTLRSHLMDMSLLTALILWGFSVLLAFSLVSVFGSVAGVLLVIPATILSWNQGMWRGVLLTSAGFFIFVVLLQLSGIKGFELIFRSGSSTGILATIFLAGVIGNLGRVARSQRLAVEVQTRTAAQHKAQNQFLSLLNDIVTAALETDDMASMLKILVSRMGELFNADECFITFWDDNNRLAIPMAAYGPNSPIYQSIEAKPGELTLTSSVLEAGHPLVVEDPRNSPFVDPIVVSPFPDIQSSLVLPLISGEKKLGAILLCFHSSRQFDEMEITWGEMAARQVSLAMSKVLLLEESRKSVFEFSGLHEISQFLYHKELNKEIFGNLSETIASLLKAKTCMIFLYDQETSQISAQPSAFGMKDDDISFFQYSNNLGKKAWEFSSKGIF